MTLKLGFIGKGGIARNQLSNLAKIEGVTVEVTTAGKALSSKPIA